MHWIHRCNRRGAIVAVGGQPYLETGTIRRQRQSDDRFNKTADNESPSSA